MAHSPDDLEFLRSLGLRSSIVIPIRARDRNLGALTLITAWSGRRYGAEDVRFAQILASRIGLALDNAGLFSDLESIERRMDTVMSILDEAIVIHGADGELVFANPAAARMLGYETVGGGGRGPDRRDPRALRDPRRAGQRGRAPRRSSGRRALHGEPSRAADAARRPTARPGSERWTRTKARAIEGADGRGPLLGDRDRGRHRRQARRVRQPPARPHRRADLARRPTTARTLERVPQLLVPEFADWCSIEIPGDDGLLERVAMAHRDPARLRAAARAARALPAARRRAVADRRRACAPASRS